MKVGLTCEISLNFSCSFSYRTFRQEKSSGASAAAADAPPSEPLDDDTYGSDDELTESISELPSIAQKGGKKPLRRQSEVGEGGLNATGRAAVLVGER